MKEKVKCLICGKEVSANNSYIGSHVKRIHQILLFDYIKKYYKLKNNLFKYEKCGFCDNEAIPNFKIDHLNKEYELDYDNGYTCQTQICIQNISQLILGTPYNAKTFEHIGSNSKYLSLLHKSDIDSVKYKKSKGVRNSTFVSTLEGFIKKYGPEIGEIKYKERNAKISKANTKLYYIEKFGNIEGLIKWESYRRKKIEQLGSSKSKASKIINEFLNKHNINYIEEYKYENLSKKTGAIDFYLPDYKIIIEYYGDYWHCNPNIYESNYFHKICKKFAYEIREKDDKRINHLFNIEFKKNISILIIWESTKFTDDYLLNLLNEIKNKNVIIEI